MVKTEYEFSEDELQRWLKLRKKTIQPQLVKDLIRDKSAILITTNAVSSAITTYKIEELK